MSDSLTTLISRVQLLLGDDGTLFTTANCTAAIRQALLEYNRVAPQHAAVTITGINDQYEYELSDEDSEAVKVLDVLQEGENQDELDISLTFDDYIEDERVFFRLRQPITTSDTLIVRYTKNHTINGLDSQVESTIPAKDDQIIVDGGSAYVLITRATKRVEENNLDNATMANYQRIASHFMTAFRAGLADIGRTKRAPVGEPDHRAWNDQYHHWGQ